VSDQGATDGAAEREARERLWLWLILAASLVLSVLFALRVPLFDGSNPDETSHVSYVRLLLEQRGFVVFRANDPAYFETHQPPLYYLLCVPIYALTGGSVFAIRLVSAALQLGTIFVAYRAGRNLFPDRKEVALGVAAFVAFLPTQAQLAGAVNNDSLTTLLCTAIFWKLFRLVRNGRGGHLRGAALIGALLGVGLLTKLSVLQVIPAIAVAYFMAVRAGQIRPADAARQFAVVLAVGVLIASPWLIRNHLLYGDPLTIRIFPQTAGPGTPTPARMMQSQGWAFADYVRYDAVRTYASFWYLIPPQVLMSDIGRFVLVLLLGLGGLVGAFRRPERGGVAGGERRVVYLAVIGILLLIPFFVRFNLQFFQAQGRYFLPALLPAALLACIGWGNVGGRRAGAAVGAVVILLLLLSLYQILSH
jgi:4-amino-4-deoxy-L-arabinose transferase-like glycosyltransferase